MTRTEEIKGLEIALASVRKQDSSIDPTRTTVALPPLARWLERLIIFWLFVMALAAPHSIAATQTAWLCLIVLWVARLFARPRRRWHRTPLDYALWGLMLLTVISSFASYDRDVSLAKLRGASLFTIVYLVAGNVNTRRVLRWLAFALIASCMVNVAYTFIERAIGRGVKVEGVAPASPLAAALFRPENGAAIAYPIRNGDTLLEVDGQRIGKPEDLLAALDGTGQSHARVKIYRAEYSPVLEVPRGRLLAGASAVERLGIGSWSRGRDWRATGFYGHYVTYSEALQLLASLAFGLFIARRDKRTVGAALLLAAVAGMGLALLLTVTRASQVGFLISALVIVSVGANRRTLLIVALCTVPLVLAGLLFLQQQRNVSFISSDDGSVSWRETVWREGFSLLTSKPRHLLVGVGMDSIKRHWREWGLFDGGRIPVGHMHSTPLQFALERGVPALLVWLALVAIYARMLWRLARRCLKDEEVWAERGIALGALGGLAGFFASGLVHYNFGDSEVVMIFYFIMGLSLSVERFVRRGSLETEAS